MMNLNVLNRIDLALERLFTPSETRINPAQVTGEWLKSLGLYVDTAAGVDVTEDNALQSMAVLACVKVLSESVAQLPLILYRDMGEQGRERARDQQLFSLLHDAPNPEMTSFYWRETMMGHLLTRGNAYSEIEFNNAGQIVGLWPLRPDLTKPVRVNKALKYEVRLPQGETVLLPAERVLHIPGFGYDGMKGYSPISLARDAVGLGMATEKFGAAWFGNGSRPGGVYKHPGHLSDKAHERLKESLEEKHKGLDNAHRVAILEEGLEWQQIGVPPEDSQFLETRKFQLNEIARMYRVPAHMIGDLDRSTFSNIEQQSLEFVIYSLTPWLVRWEQQMMKDLLKPAERQQFYTRFSVDGLLRGDNESRWEAYMKGLQSGVYSINDVLKLEDMNPIDGGDVHLVPLNMIPLDMVMSQPQAPPDDNDDARSEKRSIERRDRASQIGRQRLRLAQSYERLFHDAAARVVRRETADVGRAIGKHLEKRNEQSFMDWLREFYEEHRAFWIKTMLPILMSYADIVGADVGEELSMDAMKSTEIDAFIEQYVESLAYRETASSEGQIRALVEQALLDGEDAAPIVQERLTEWDEKRAGKVANHESRNSMYAFAIAFYGASQIVSRLLWVANGDSCPYCQAMNGRTVAIDEVFLSKDEPLDPEGGDGPLSRRTDITHPPLHSGCDCSTIAVIG